MPTTSAPAASGRLLALLSLLQARRDWPGPVLRERLGVSERTLRRDVDRLRELGYPVRAVRGPDGGYRLDAGSRLPPLLFDDEQAVALAVALRAAVVSGAAVGEAAVRALATLGQVLPARLRGRVEGFEATVVARADAPADPQVLLAISAAVRAREELRFDHGAPADGELRPPRQVQPHALVARAGRWYLVAWDPGRGDWRSFRADRIRLRMPNGPRFVPREVPGGDAGAWLSARLRGSAGPDAWPCRGEVLLDLPAADVVPFVGDGTVEPAGEDRCRVRLGSWSWTGLAASLARFDADVEVVGPPELRDAFAALAARAARAAGGPDMRNEEVRLRAHRRGR
ncbi:helix-turn-helix transcriptional regulator [Geodermatophilus nigrescens]|uniref:Predicted DNA-binding transcriptional regulator YafY, contains an HTH and WYL domains n=1 Tax=Geodermatophilus nigrescens TaxID=1070870 RepID=A0A1M5DI56_9ACTN|nr:WYL domain-containing protein [Geodermatophilus nigrescens]SHF66596.1 Predicted DNA-binding transcriptional regulator YafY, contains an HTH and WYL domains [Geodermatophilus nigrescens]